MGKSSPRKFKKEKERIRRLLSLELEFWKKDLIVCGVDEVGRGALAGPLFTCALILDPEKLFNKIEDSSYIIGDSKALSKEKREFIESIIKDISLDYSFGFVESEVIERYGIVKASKIAMNRALDSLQVKADIIIVDYLDLSLENSISLEKADKRSFSVACASILAKLLRDRVMDSWSKYYPFYSFEKNKGYGTKEHLESIEINGVCPIHRKSFEPIKSML